MTEKTDRGCLIKWASEAKSFMFEARETDDPLPSDELILRATVAYDMLRRNKAILHTGSDPIDPIDPDDHLARSHAIAVIASNFADVPPRMPRSVLFATELG